MMKSKLMTSCNPVPFADKSLCCHCGESFESLVSDVLQNHVTPFKQHGYEYRPTDAIWLDSHLKMSLITQYLYANHNIITVFT